MTAKEWTALYANDKQKAFGYIYEVAKPYLRFGIRISILIAQLFQESYKGGGKWSKLFLVQNNGFGVKRDSGVYLPTEEVINGVKIDVNDHFAAYSSFEKSITDYCRIMCGYRYFYVRAAETIAEAAARLGDSPYATDLYYGECVYAWITSLGVQRFDTYAFSSRKDQVFDSMFRGDHGPWVEETQRMLRGIGYDIAVDGAYGVITFAIVKDFQSRVRILADGVCGIVTYLMLEQSVKALYVLGEEIINGEPIEEPDISEKVINLTDFVQFLKIESENKKGRIRYEPKQNEELGSVGELS